MAEGIDVRDRGSSMLLKAWQSGDIKLSDEVVTGLSEVLNGVQGRIETAQVGEGKRSVSVGISYADDDGPRCGNDISLILGHLHKVGPVPVQIIINGIPAFESLLVQYKVGEVGET